MIKEAITKAVKGENLGELLTMGAMEEIMTGVATPAQIGAFLAAMRIKGESVEELTGAARIMRAKSVKLNLNNGMVTLDRDEINVDRETVLDTCGTGGDGTRTFNISTTSAFVVAGEGVKVAKHGKRAVSSQCGSADVLEALGVNLDVSTTDVERSIATIGIGFLYAPLFQGAMRHAAGARREIGVRTLLNLLGPLTNPAGASVQVLGVYEPVLTEKVAEVLRNLGSREAFVVCGEGTFDEISICGPTIMSHLKNGRISTTTMIPGDFGMKSYSPEEIRGGSARRNAEIVREVLGGRKGAKRDIVLLNAGAAFVAAGRTGDFREGMELAAQSIDSGRAAGKLDELIAFTQRCRPFVMDSADAMGAALYKSEARNMKS
ncbi:MAG: anthranilate phosphoribosyltransferase [Desulfatiglandaceae bacterium]